MGGPTNACRPPAENSAAAGPGGRSDRPRSAENGDFQFGHEGYGEMRVHDAFRIQLKEN